MPEWAIIPLKEIVLINIYSFMCLSSSQILRLSPKNSKVHLLLSDIIFFQLPLQKLFSSLADRIWIFIKLRLDHVLTCKIMISLSNLHWYNIYFFYIDSSAPATPARTLCFLHPDELSGQLGHRITIPRFECMGPPLVGLMGKMKTTITNTCKILIKFHVVEFGIVSHTISHTSVVWHCQLYHRYDHYKEYCTVGSKITYFESNTIILAKQTLTINAQYLYFSISHSVS